MSKTAMNTHRRAMRPVTPAVRAGRTAAGAAIAATMLFGGAAAATADGSTEADAANAGAAKAAPAVIPVNTQLPSQKIAKVATAKKADSEVLATVKATEATSLTAKPKPEPKPEPKPRVAVETDTDQQDRADTQDEAPATQGASAPSAQREDTQEQDSAPAASTASRSTERSSSSDDSSSRSTSSHSSSSSSSSSSSAKKKSPSTSSEKKSSSSASSASGSSIVATAQTGIGTPYVMGGTSKSGWDCSGFTQWVYAQHGINLPRVDTAQAAGGRTIPKSEARPGDLVHTAGHIGIYAGGDMMIDAGNPRVGTSKRHIYSGSWTFVTYTH